MHAYMPIRQAKLERRLGEDGWTQWAGGLASISTARLKANVKAILKANPMVNQTGNLKVNLKANQKVNERQCSVDLEC